jgi:hypothetical protein
MPIYTADFFTEADWAETRIAADTPELTLQRALQIDSDETGTLDFQTSTLTGTDPLLLIRIDPASAHGFVVSRADQPIPDLRSGNFMVTGR